MTISSTNQVHANSNTPVRCLIIQLARLGDTIQSLMALRAAKQLYPNLEITFLARERFAGAVKKVPWIHQTICLPSDALLGPILQGTQSETQALGDLARWLSPLIKNPWDMVVNWTFSEASSYLTALIPSRVKLGYTRRRDSTFAGADGWSHYIQAIIQGRVHQNIHLTDVLTTQLLTALQIHVGEPTGNANSAVTSKSFFTLALEDSENQIISDDINKKWISIQLGSSRHYKNWDSKCWTRFIQLILEKHHDVGIYLLGGEADIPVANEILQEISPTYSDSLISLVGKTYFDFWAATISRSQWLVATDTAAIHLASVLGVRVLNLSIGPVRFFETGPYGNGHYVISPHSSCEACHSSNVATLEHTCGKAISPEVAYGVWSFALNEGIHRKPYSFEKHFHQLAFTKGQDKLDLVKIYRSKIRNTQDGGGVHYEQILNRSLTLEEWTGKVMGHLARAWYCGWLPPIGQEVQRETIGPQLVKKLREMSESTQVLSKICQQASQTAESLNLMSASLKSSKIMPLQARMELQKLGNTLQELEGLLDRITKTHPALLGFSFMSKVLMHHLEGAQLSELGKETAESYKQLNEGVAIYRQWIQYTLDLVKPMAIRPVSQPIKETNP